MKKPKIPDNSYYWLNVIKDPELVKRFQEKGDKRQLRNLELALKYSKWLQIQERSDKDGRATKFRIFG